MGVINRKSINSSFDILDHILEFQELYTEQATLIADLYKAPTLYETCLLIHRTLRGFRYRKDGIAQVIKTPYAILRTNQGDCKSFSVFAYSILEALGYQPEYVLVNGDGTENPDHIYVCVPDQGKIIYLDGTIYDFPAEPFYLMKWQK
jgi:hypothetical protein